MITNKAIQKKPEHKQVMQLQSWYEPALRTLDGLLEIRRANLRKIKGDEKNAAVTRDEFMETLINEHHVSVWYAGEIISSLHRAGHIFMFGRFIKYRKRGCSVRYSAKRGQKDVQAPAPIEVMIPLLDPVKIYTPKELAAMPYQS